MDSVQNSGNLKLMRRVFGRPWRLLNHLRQKDVVASPKPVELQMVWPQTPLAKLPTWTLPDGYFLRTYQSGDEIAFFGLMDRAGFRGWNMHEFQSWLQKILPDGFFFVFHGTSSQMVATAMAVHNPTPLHPFGATLSCVAAEPSHWGQGLGRVVSAAVMHRLVQAGYKEIYMETDDWRLAAIKTYLRLGWVPYLFLPDMLGRWKAICETLGWPYSPQVWPAVETARNLGIAAGER